MPVAWEGPIWAYADWCDSLLEDVLFRIASPLVRDRIFTQPNERALLTFIKERKFGAACVDDWRKTQGSLLARAREPLLPTCASLGHKPFIVGENATLADAALYGLFAMLKRADAGLLDAFDPLLKSWMERLEAVAEQCAQRR